MRGHALKCRRASSPANVGESEILQRVQRKKSREAKPPKASAPPLAAGVRHGEHERKTVADNRYCLMRLPMALAINLITCTGRQAWGNVDD